MKKLISVLVGLWLVVGATSLSARPRNNGNKSQFRTVSKNKFKTKYHAKRARRSSRSRIRH